MGWSFGWKDRASLVAELSAIDTRRRFVKPEPWNDGPGWFTQELLAKSLVGNHLWMVIRQKFESAVSETALVTGEKSQTVITLALLEREKGDNGKPDWGYKGFDEASHPYYYSCPKKFLAMAPVVNAEWRDGVAEYHAKRSAKFGLGDTVVLSEGCAPARLTVTSVRPLRGRSDAGVTFRIPRKMIARVEPAAMAVVEV